MLSGKKVLVGVTGGIAAYKILDMVSRLKKKGCQVQVMMTEAATKFVGPTSFEALSERPVYTDLWVRAEEGITHIDLTKWADVFIIAPATANILAKAAMGIADDLLSTTIVAADCPMIFAPAMNSTMLNNPATQENIRLLRERGIQVLETGYGLLACRTTGDGRLPEPPVLVEAIENTFDEKDLEGKKVLVSAGPTREYFDPVRFLTNRSTGRMGFALAKRAARRGAQVVLVSGPVSLETPEGVERVDVETNQQMLEALEKEFQDADALIMSAAPCDFKPKDFRGEKIKKQSREDLQMEENIDILKTLGQEKTHQILIGFAAETSSLKEYAMKKLEEKNLDYIVANDVSQEGAGFGTQTNIATILSKDSAWEYPLMQKEELADHILDLLKEGKKED